MGSRKSFHSKGQTVTLGAALLFFQVAGILFFQIVAPGQTPVLRQVLGSPVISISPASTAVSPSQTVQFTATGRVRSIGTRSLARTAKVDVVWSLNPAVGSITADGLYTAPATAAATQTVTVTATSTSDPTISAAATLTLTPSVTVSITPTSVSLQPSQGQTFTATDTGTSNTGVTWSFSPSIGSLVTSPNGTSATYVAPTTLQEASSVIITASSVANPSRTATAVITLVQAITVALNPSTVNLAPSATQQFTATVSGASNTAVAWSISPLIGSITAAGLFTAPASIASAQTVNVTATSIADSTKSATAAVAVTPPVAVSLTPSSVSLQPSQSQTLTATVTGASSTGVNWSFSPALGSLATSGATAVYVAPSTAPTTQTVTITAASTANPSKTATAVITVPQAVTLSLSPSTVSLTPSGTQQFTAAVSGTSKTAVTWSIRPAVGTISAAGLYAAPSTILTSQTSVPQVVSVTAISGADPSVSASSTVSLVPPVSVTVSPGRVSLTPSQTQAFTAAVANTPNTAVTWSLSPAVGRISAAGVYTAPAAMPSSPTVTVIATSMSDPTKSGVAELTTVPPQAAGYSLVWQDSFSALSLCTTQLAGCNWYDPGLWYAGPAGTITDPSGNYANLQWATGQSNNSTSISTASQNLADYHAWTYGYFEVSMAFDAVTGNWPGLWLMSLADGPGNATNGLPYAELDMFEWQSQAPTTFNGTIHVWEDGSFLGSQYVRPTPQGITYSNFNTYGVLWTPTSITWYLNDVSMGSVSTNSTPYNKVFKGQQPLFLILSQQAGCDWLNTCPGQVSPLDMKVQWVHVYQTQTH